MRWTPPIFRHVASTAANGGRMTKFGSALAQRTSAGCGRVGRVCSSTSEWRRVRYEEALGHCSRYGRAGAGDDRTGVGAAVQEPDGLEAGNRGHRYRPVREEGRGGDTQELGGGQVR